MAHTWRQKLRFGHRGKYKYYCAHAITRDDGGGGGGAYWRGETTRVLTLHALPAAATPRILSRAFLGSCRITIILYASCRTHGATTDCASRTGAKYETVALKSQTLHKILYE